MGVDRIGESNVERVNPQPDPPRPAAQEGLQLIAEAETIGARALQSVEQFFARLHVLGAPAQANPPAPDQPQTFTSAAPTVTDADRDRANFGDGATPGQAAAFLVGEYGSRISSQEQAQIFAQVLEEHQHDPAWVREFFTKLGSDKAAQYVNDAMLPGTYSSFGYSPGKEEVQKRMDAVRNAFYGATRDGHSFTQADMDRFAQGLAKVSTFAPQIATDLFGKLPYGEKELKNMFFAAAARASFDKSGRTANELAAAATHVLSLTDSANEVEQLNKIYKEGKLNSLITKAMAGQDVAVGPIDSWGMQRPEFTEFGRVNELLEAAAYVDGRSPGERVSMTDQERADLRVAMFNAFTEGLTNGDVARKYQNTSNEWFPTKDSILQAKDALAHIYMQDYNGVIRSGLIKDVNGQAGNDARLSNDFRARMEAFYKTELFTPPYGGKESTVSKLSGFMSDTLSALRDGINAGNDDALNRFDSIATDGNLTRIEAAHLLGEQMGLLTNALQASREERKKNAEAQAAGVKLVLDLAFSLLPKGVDKLGDLGADFITKILGFAEDKIRDAIKDKGVEAAKQYIMDQYGVNLDAEKMVSRMDESFSSTLRTRPEDYAGAYDSSYTYAETSDGVIAPRDRP